MRKKRIKNIKIGLILTCAIVLCKTQVVSFYDKEFECAVRDYLLPGCVSMLVKREEPIKGPILRKKVNNVENIYIDLNKYKIKDMRDLGHFKNLEGLHLGYIPEDFQADIIPNGEMPQNLDAICKLNYLERINLYRMNINNSFKTVQTSLKKLCLYDCAVADDNFIENLPEINVLVICDSDISSFEFLKTTQRLSTLWLYDNTYGCSLDQFKIAHNIEELQLISDETNIFEQLPYIPTVKKLYLQGDGAPKRTEAEKYLSWENLEGLYLEDEKYDAATNTWSDYWFCKTS